MATTAAVKPSVVSGVKTGIVAGLGGGVVFGMLMAMMNTKKTVIQTPTFRPTSQYSTVKPATVSSRGKTMAHWKT